MNSYHHTANLNWVSIRIIKAVKCLKTKRHYSRQKTAILQIWTCRLQNSVQKITYQFIVQLSLECTWVRKWAHYLKLSRTANEFKIKLCLNQLKTKAWIAHYSRENKWISLSIGTQVAIHQWCLQTSHLIKLKPA